MNFLRLYGRRKGRPLRVRKSRLMQELLPKLQINLPASGQIDPRVLFPFHPKEIWLEVGFGGGEHLAAQAKKHPAIGFVGCEPFVNGVASLLDHIEREHLSNIHIFPSDARVLLDVLPDASVDLCFVLFADPWPKARHAGRRFIGAENLVRLARVLKTSAELRLATDDGQLAGWMREAVSDAGQFKLLEDSTEPPAGWIPTRYEQKAIKVGRKPVYMSYCRL